MKDAMAELKAIAEKKMGMPWAEIMKQAERDDAARKKKGDPIAKAHKEGSVSPKKMFKDSMKQLNKLGKK